MILLLALACTPTLRAIDDDGDGWPATDDCNDADAAVFPFAPEACGEDRDCDLPAPGGPTGTITVLFPRSASVSSASGFTVIWR